MITNRTLPALLLVLSSLAMASMLFSDAFSSALYIWKISEIFNHCFLILPISAFLIYRQRDELKQVEFKPFYPGFLALFGILVVQVFAQTGDIKVLNHIALFTFIPVAIVTFIGLKASAKIAFPLAYMLLAIPIGEELIPYLQSITADMSVFLLNLAGIPVFHSGLYIDIPNGKFLVAEACSGISFLISSIAFGSLYAHLNFVSTRAKIGFTLLAASLPIFANTLRVFGIITIAHVSNMEYATGADHLIYGWFFYLLVLALLFFLGEFLSRKSRQQLANRHQEQTSIWRPMPDFRGVSLGLTVLVALSLVWQIQVRPSEEVSDPRQLQWPAEFNTDGLNPLGTEFVGASKISNKKIRFEQQTYHLLVAQYPAGGENEAISSKNELFDKDAWSRVGWFHSINMQQQSVSYFEYTSVGGQAVATMNLYVVDGKAFASATKAKLYETYRIVMGQHSATFNIVITTLLNSSSNKDNIDRDSLEIMNKLKQAGIIQ